MIPLRRVFALLLMGALLALVGFSAGSCAKNDLFGQGLDRYVLVSGASPTGFSQDVDPDSSYKWAVNSIDSVIFANNIDSVTLEVTSFEAFDTVGHLIPGQVRFMPGNAYIHYTEDFPSNAYAFTVSHPPLGTTMSKVYFIPDKPYSGHRTYAYVLTTGVRMLSGKLVRNKYAFGFATGDSVAPPNPIWPEREGDIH
jgi:hypothetical protein